MIKEKKQITPEQMLNEKEYANIIKDHINGKISKKEANTRITQLLEHAYKEGIFTKEDIDVYNRRRDRVKMRDHVQFALDLKKWHDKEYSTLKYLVEKIASTGREVEYERLGSDEHGYIMIANFGSRSDSPNKPDYKVKWVKDFKYVEVKNFSPIEIWLKVANVKKYKEWNSYMLIKFGERYYIFSHRASDFLLKNMPYAAENRKGKKSIIITMNGNNAHYSIKDLIKLNYVKQI
jgi:hypothetical protein